MGDFAQPFNGRARSRSRRRCQTRTVPLRSCCCCPLHIAPNEVSVLSPVRRLHARGPRFIIATGLALGLYAPMVLAQDVLIGMNDVHQPGGPDELVQVDRTTGVATRLHVFTSTGFNFLESLAYDARENVFWTTNDDVLIRVQPATFVTQ